MDCAEFVCRVMSSDQITDGVKHMAGSGLKAFLDNNEKFEFSTTPKVGDIAVWDGHVGIVTEVGENGNIKLTHARGTGKFSAENPYAIAPEKYRPGSKFFGYYRPLVETPDGKLDGGNVPTTQVAEDNTVYEAGILAPITVVGQGTTTLKPIIEVRVEPRE